MKYLLKNKDKIVLEFEISQKQSIENHNILEEYAKNIILKDKDLLPIHIDSRDIENNLLKWIKKRKAPSNRSYIKKIIATYKDSTSEEKIMDYVNVSFALSLNDSYWITPAGKDYKWSDYNLYSNDFAKSLELAAFGIASQKVSGFTSSPEYTTNGMLAKCWHRENGQIYLYKGSSKIYDNGEAYSEYYMTQVARMLEFTHIPYDLQMFHNRLVSTCPIFTNENEGFIPIGYCIDTIARKEKGFRLIKEVEKIYGQEKLQDLMVFDAIICNIDRHLGNFGMIIDNNTNEILRPAPIFDNGLSMMTTLESSELSVDKKFLGFEKSAFEITFNNQLEYFVQSRHIENLEKLKSFEFTKHKYFNLPDIWLESIQKTIQERAELALDFCMKTQTARERLNAMPKPRADKADNKVSAVQYLQTHTILKNTEIQKLKKITQKEYEKFVENVLNGSLEKLRHSPNVLYIGNLNGNLATKLGLYEAKVYIAKSDLHHARQIRKKNFNQDIPIQNYKNLPSLIDKAKEAYIDNIPRHKNFFLVETLNNNEVATYHFNKDLLGNYFVTARRIAYSSLKQKEYTLVRSGIEPHIEEQAPSLPSGSSLTSGCNSTQKSNQSQAEKYRAAKSHKSAYSEISSVSVRDMQSKSKIRRNK